MVLRVYVQRKSGFEGEAKALLKEVKDLLGITELQRIDLLNRYDVEGISEELFESCIPTVFQSHSPILPAVPCQSFLLKVRLFIRLLLSFCLASLTSAQTLQLSVCSSSARESVHLCALLAFTC